MSARASPYINMKKVQAQKIKLVCNLSSNNRNSTSVHPTTKRGNVFCEAFRPILFGRSPVRRRREKGR
ncbi:hypothetical protein E2C01_062038 [Portunus trituberculatus]|uniref:Uncharacterized protein n=1 Tax=Portunus trituberculatus TaxID=210409 RepID=A0A5B7H9W8_PORTR|nr:hypothetical protein [Portunus trituberculatus]